MNLVFGSGEESDQYWRDEVWPLLLQKFEGCVDSRDDAEAGLDASSLRSYVTNPPQDAKSKGETDGRSIIFELVTDSGWFPISMIIYISIYVHTHTHLYILNIIVIGIYILFFYYYYYYGAISIRIYSHTLHSIFFTLHTTLYHYRLDTLYFYTLHTRLYYTLYSHCLHTYSSTLYTLFTLYYTPYTLQHYNTTHLTHLTYLTHYVHTAYILFYTLHTYHIYTYYAHAYTEREESLKVTTHNYFILMTLYPLHLYTFTPLHILLHVRVQWACSGAGPL